jgi:membrane-associated phospholipid phosphatase
VRLSVWTRSRVALTALLLSSMVVMVVAAPAHSHPKAADAAEITNWDAIAVRTIVTEGMRPPAETQLYLGFVSAAMYDAVVAIEPAYAPYGAPLRAHRHASVDAAVAAAAHGVLSIYFPASGPALTADYQTSLAKIPDGRAKAKGIAVGEAAAALIVQLRTGDGRNAPIAYTRPAAPGVWRPTSAAQFLIPWLGFVRPLLLSSPTQIPLSGPDALTSAAYTRDFNEVKAVGSATSAVRTPEQTQTARFWNDNLPVQFQAALRDRVARRGLNAVQAARMFAVLNMSAADTLIATWRAKFEFAFWRPVTAIQLADTDGNPATVADPAWMPLVASPPYPEYPSGHASIVGATTKGLSRLFGRHDIDLFVSSAVPGAGPTRHYTSARTLNEDTINARVWLGIHFRKADVDANRLGRAVARFALANYFQPTH